MSGVETTILLVDDDPVDRDMIGRMINSYPNYILRYQENASGLIDSLKSDPVDCVLLDYRLGLDDGITLVTEIVDALPLVPPIILLTGQGCEKSAIRAFRAGVADYLLKDEVDPFLLHATIDDVVEKERKKRVALADQERFVQLAMYDPVTGLPNRNYLMERLETALATATREKRVFAILLIDMDNFKSINDRFGHAIGDEALRVFSARLRGIARQSDTIARLAGDEFVCLLETHEDVDSILRATARIEQGLAFRGHLGDLSYEFSASVGAAIYPRDGETVEALLCSADASMYASKRVRRIDYKIA